MSSNHRIVAARSTQEIGTVRELFREYARELGQDFCFQGFERELAELPGKYAPPTGEVFLAFAADALAGCVAVRPCQTFEGGGARDEPGVCEMKRMYVRPPFRRTGLGRVLAARILATARELGYQRMRLDTLRSMVPALTLYRSLGFAEIAPYYANPLENVVYLEKSPLAD